MSKLFKMSLEETVDNITVEDPVDNDEELVENTTKLAVEIEEMDNVAGQVVDSIKTLSEQLANNESKLADKDNVVTTVDVEVSEEALKRSLYSLGEKPTVVLSFANESIYNDIKSNPRRYLTISNEELDDVLKKLLYKLREFINRVAIKIVTFVQQLIIKLGGFVDKFVKNVTTIKTYQDSFLDAKQETVDGIKSDLEKMNTAEARYPLFNNGKVNVYYMHKDGAINGLKGIKKLCAEYLKLTREGFKKGNAGVIKNFSATAAMTAKTPVAEYGYKELPVLLIAPPSGNKGLTLKTIDLTSTIDILFKATKLVKVDLEPADKQPNFNKDGVENLFKFITANEVTKELRNVKESSNAMTREVKESNKYAEQVLNDFQQNHNQFIMMNNISQSINIRLFLHAMAESLKSYSLTANMYYVNAYFTTFKFIYRLSSIMTKYATGKEVDPNQKLLTK